MTNNLAKRVLPPIPHPDHLRKEAKARLASLKGRMPSVRLTDVQLILAREYGFPNWGMLQAEVARRSGEGRRMRKAVAAASALRRTPLESGHDPQVETFFRAGLMVQVGFILVAFTGMGLVFLDAVQTHSLALENVALLAHKLL
jgi:hypothetical protein